MGLAHAYTTTTTTTTTKHVGGGGGGVNTRPRRYRRAIKVRRDRAIDAMRMRMHSRWRKDYEM